ncbi:MAG: LysM peptidoglycan-binding domain-containing protein, partial [Flavobacteriales bacterium]|nr:LysM peptidoglycan-binding domain-containing protein [Flavobacteriales bacterium]
SIPMGVRKNTPKVAEEGRVHIVKAGETLYGISRKYKVKVDQIKKWNNLQSESLNIDQRISIGKQLEADEILEESLPFPGARKHFVQTSETLEQISAKRNVSMDSLKKWNNLRSNDLRIGQIIWYRNYDRSSEPMTVKEVFGKKIEQGVAKQIEDMEDTDKYLALHKTLPSGTLLEVRNLMNNKKVFVRVVGQLPAAGLNENVIVRLTPKSFKRLGILDARAQVEITYYDD